MKYTFLVLASLFLGTKNMEVPKVLIKIVSPQLWEDSLNKEFLILEGIDITDDFIHLSTQEQSSRIIKKFWNDKKFIVLHLDPSKLNGTLKYESNPGGESKYYHLYDGSIPLSAVTEVIYP